MVNIGIATEMLLINSNTAFYWPLPGLILVSHIFTTFTYCPQEVWGFPIFLDTLLSS